MRQRKEIVTWLYGLEDYARRQEMSMRILDRISECRDEIQSAKKENKITIINEVEEILNSIRTKVESKESQLAGGDIVISRKDVENRMKQMYHQCQEDNQTVLHNLSESKNSIAEKYSRQMQDAEATLSMLKNEVEYIHFYESIADNYKKESLYMVQGLLEEMDKNFGYMLEHMKKMFHSISSLCGEQNIEKIFYELDTKKKNISSKIKNKVVNSNLGCDGIINFARTTVKEIKKIVGRRKKIRRVIVAVLAVVILLTMGIGYYMESKHEIISPTTQTEEVSTETVSTIMDNVSQSIETFEMTSGFLEKFPQFGFLAGSGVIIMLAIFLIMIVVFIFAMKRMKRSDDAYVSQKCAEYLKYQFIEFEKEKILIRGLEDWIQSVAEEYEQQQLKLLNEVVSEYGIVSQNTDSFEMLVEEWKRLKNERGW